MCGIYGFVGKIKKGKHKQVLKLIKHLAIETEIRGIDATGFFSISKSNVMSEKDAIEASEFVEADNTFVNSIVDNNPYIWVGHNRAASMGALDSTSAHPFTGEEHIMVHNGTCPMVFDVIDDEITAKMKTETDSEAILHLIERDGLKETFKRLTKYSIVIANFKTDEIWFARDPKRPLVIYDLRKLYGVRMFCSTRDIGRAAMEKLRINVDNVPHFVTKSFHLYSADYKDGEITNHGRFYTPIIEHIEQPPIGPEPPTTTYEMIDPNRPKSFGQRVYEKYFSRDKDSEKRIRNSMAVYGD